ncbi:MAG: hypothetical protein V4439_04480 [Patescibacteria group bacterium]
MKQSEHKPKRVKANKKEIEKKIDADFQRKYRFIAPGKGKQEFILPDETPLNNMFGHPRPFVRVSPEGKFSSKGEHGHLKFYYIPKDTYEKVIALFNEFQIPNDLHKDLIWVFLSMFFASCEALLDDQLRKESENHKIEFVKLFKMLESLENSTIFIREVKIAYKDVLEGRDKKGLQNLGKMKYEKIAGSIGINLISKTLKTFKSIPDFASTFETSYNVYVSENYPPFHNWGHKNKEKYWQSFFSHQIYDYLFNRIFRSAFELFDNPDKFQKEVQILKIKYPKSKLFLFIGKLMMLSELLKVNPNTEEEEISNQIKKKLAPYLKAEKKRTQEAND